MNDAPQGQSKPMPPRSDVMFELTRPKFGQRISRQEWITEFEKGNNMVAPK